ncbi:MAG: DUF1573 domain-containing protein [Bacteroidota bacterium]
MRPWFLVFFLFIALLPAYTQGTPTPIAEPQAEVKFLANAFDFGTIKAGETVNYDYALRNTGNAPLLIIDAKSSCGCAIPRWPRAPIAPGASAVVTFTFNSQAKEGLQNLVLTLTTNTDPAQHELFLVGKVEANGELKVVEAAPAEQATPTTTEIVFAETVFDFGTIVEGELVAHTYNFTNTGSVPLVISGAKGSCGCTVPAWSREPIAPGDTGQITVEFNSKAKRGKRNQKVTITANTNPPQSFIYLTGEIAPKGSQPVIPPLLSPDEEPEKVEPTIPEPPKSAATIIDDPNCVTLFPNPTTDRLQLEIGEQAGQPAMIALYNYTGQRMAQRQWEAIGAVVSFDVSDYPAGSYVIRMQIGELPAETQCFVVKR